MIPFCWLVALLFITCNSFKKNKVESYIPGTYTRVSEHEFGKEYDTLVISALPGAFKIVRKWKYDRVLDGAALEPEYKEETTTATYDDEHRLLYENETGIMISVDMKNDILFIGPTKYYKLE